MSDDAQLVIRHHVQVAGGIKGQLATPGDKCWIRLMLVIFWWQFITRDTQSCSRDGCCQPLSLQQRVTIPIAASSVCHASQFAIFQKYRNTIT